MTRYHSKYDAETGETLHIPFTPEEEAERDAEEAAIPAAPPNTSQFLAMQDRRAKALEAQGDQIGALLLRRKYEI